MDIKRYDHELCGGYSQKCDSVMEARADGDYVEYSALSVEAKQGEPFGYLDRFDIFYRERIARLVLTPLYAQSQPAIPAEAKQGEPVAWYTEDHLIDKSATTWNEENARRWREKGWPVMNLYTHPASADEKWGA